MDSIHDRTNERHKNILHDVEVIKKACQEDDCCPFNEFEYSDYVFRFKYDGTNEKHSYRVILNEEYPRNSIWTWIVNGSMDQSMKPSDLPLPFVFNSIAKELYRDLAVPSLSTSHSDEGTGHVEEEDDDDEDEEEDDDYYKEEYKAGDDQEHAEIQDDFDQLRRYCPDAEINEFPALDEVEIGFALSTEFLEDQSARAWNLTPYLPIHIKLSMSRTKYIEDCSAAKVEVYQDKDRRNVSCVLHQLQTIVERFVKRAGNGCCKQSRDEFETNEQLSPKQPCSQPKLKMPRLSTSGTSQSVPPSPPREDPSDVSHSDPKDPPNGGKGFLVELFSYAKERLRTLNNYCVVCDELHPLTNTAMLKPIVCDKPLCIFTYVKFDVTSLTTSTSENTTREQNEMDLQVVDLLIAFAKAACNSARWNTIFDPFPKIVDPDNCQQLVFPDKDKETVEHVKQVMAKFIPMEEMTRMLGVELKSQLDSTDRLLYPMLQWILDSNRSYIVSLDPQQCLSFMNTAHQFLLRSSPPAKEAAFRKAKELYGSIFAFHGSALENWHAVVRKGLINASGTSMEVNGALHGKGIYLSPEASLSISYSSNKLDPTVGQHDAYRGPSLHLTPTQGIICFALCEVINSKILQKATNTIWVMPEEDYVVTRFLFVLSGQQKKAAVRSDDPVIVAEIQRALQC